MYEYFLIFIWPVLYILPWIIAKFRKSENSLAIFYLTILTGWTGIGWIASLIWALIKNGERK